MPETMSSERRAMLRAYGAELELTPGDCGHVGAAFSERKKFWIPCPMPICCSSFVTRLIPIFIAALPPKKSGRIPMAGVDMLVAGVGTGGTITGVADVLKQRKPNFKAIAVEPVSSPVLSGGRPGSHKIQGIGAGFVPEVLNINLIDEVVQVSDDESH